MRRWRRRRVWNGGQTGFAGHTPGRGRLAAAIDAYAEGAPILPASLGGLPVSLGGKGPACRTAAAAGRGRGLAAFYTEGAVGLFAAPLDAGAVGLPADGKAVVAARIAIGGHLDPASHAEAGLLPFFLAALQALAAEGEVFFVAGGAEAPAGFVDDRAAFCTEAPVAPQQASFAGRHPIAGAAFLKAWGAVSGALGRTGATAVETEALRGKAVAGKGGV